jgi:hypothetical protein
MPGYHVCWDIEVVAETAIEAARLARTIQLDPSTLASVFEVMRKEDYDNFEGDWEVVDLWALDHGQDEAGEAQDAT